ncbi:YlxR family protein [Thermodesulfatator atlanticus]
MEKARKRHVPQRSCIICKEKKDKHKLLRLVLDERGRVLFDADHRLPGRGAYVCSEDTCVAKLLTKHGDKRLRYAFKGKAKELPQKTIDEILARLRGQ